MLWNPTRCQYSLEPEDRTAIHEGGHLLVNMIMLGSPGVVEMGHYGQGATCKSIWRDDLGLDPSPQARALHKACLCLAGYAAETIGFGQPNEHTCADDLRDLESALQEARQASLLLDKKNIRVVIDWLIKMHWGAVVAAAACLRPNSSRAGDEIAKAMIRTDETGMMEYYHRTPILSGRDWRANWNTLKRLSGKAYAKAYMARQN
jgi:hypothetical protein